MERVRLAILCSGQGAQHHGMFDLARTDSAAARMLETWQVPASFAPADDLFANRAAQPLLVKCACATWEAVRHHLPPPVAVAGYSVGEVTALAVAGVIDAAQAVALAQTRAALMDDCVDPTQPQGLLAIGGLALQATEQLLVDMGATGIGIAIVNGADQCIVGGLWQDGNSGPGLNALAARLDGIGIQVNRLSVTIASHTAWMRKAVAPLHDVVARFAPHAPQTRLLAGISGAASSEGAVALAALVAQTDQTVRWDACMDSLAEAGVTKALELGPGSALSRMLAVRHPQIACRSVSDFRSVAGIAAWAGRQ